ncbi:MAG: BlaI/MecI/CopY family transcriptional regulator [Planctomycetaceae bacterium]
MARPASEHPTELELQILKILWQQSPLPVRDVRQALADQGRDIAHTSVITTLNTMVEKRYLSRKSVGNALYFSPRTSHASVSRRMLGDVVERLFGGSSSAALLSIFESSDIDADELKELRRLIDRKLKEKS